MNEQFPPPLRSFKIRRLDNIEVGPVEIDVEAHLIMTDEHKISAAIIVGMAGPTQPIYDVVHEWFGWEEWSEVEPSMIELPEGSSSH